MRVASLVALALASPAGLDTTGSLPAPGASGKGGVFAESAAAGAVVVGTGADDHLLATFRLPHVASNAALKTTAGAAGRRVYRSGFTTAGDGGGAPYDWSTSNCVAADDGAQV
jgi:hypothetical protein